MFAPKSLHVTLLRYIRSRLTFVSCHLASVRFGFIRVVEVVNKSSYISVKSSGTRDFLLPLCPCTIFFQWNFEKQVSCAINVTNERPSKNSPY